MATIHANTTRPTSQTQGAKGLKPDPDKVDYKKFIHDLEAGNLIPKKNSLVKSVIDELNDELTLTKSGRSFQKPGKTDLNGFLRKLTGKLDVGQYGDHAPDAKELSVLRQFLNLNIVKQRLADPADSQSFINSVGKIKPTGGNASSSKISNSASDLATARAGNNEAYGNLKHDFEALGFKDGKTPDISKGVNLATASLYWFTTLITKNGGTLSEKDLKTIEDSQLFRDTVRDQGGGKNFTLRMTPPQKAQFLTAIRHLMQNSRNGQLDPESFELAEKWVNQQDSKFNTTFNPPSPQTIKTRNGSEVVVNDTNSMVKLIATTRGELGLVVGTSGKISPNLRWIAEAIYGSAAVNNGSSLPQLTAGVEYTPNKNLEIIALATVGVSPKNSNGTKNPQVGFDVQGHYQSNPDNQGNGQNLNVNGQVGTSGVFTDAHYQFPLGSAVIGPYIAYNKPSKAFSPDPAGLPPHSGLNAGIEGSVPIIDKAAFNLIANASVGTDGVTLGLNSKIPVGKNVTVEPYVQFATEGGFIGGASATLGF